jgi:hypothetical protein
VIPAEAVEAAAIAWVGEQVWQDCNEAWRADYLERAQVFLEAAAPHMLASVSTLDALVLLEPGTVLQGPDFHEETYKCTGPGTFHTIASTTEYRASELVGRGPFTIIYRSRADGDH